jgi:hypothetical protein
MVARSLSPDQQLRLLEKLCVLQSINNLLGYPELRQKSAYSPTMYAYYSLSPLPADEPIFDPRKIGLMIYNPQTCLFSRAKKPGSNDGIRIVDLVDPAAFIPRGDDPFQITQAVDLSDAVRKEVAEAQIGNVPRIDVDVRVRRPVQRRMMLRNRKPRLN